MVSMLHLTISGFGDGLSDRGARCDDGRGVDEQRRVHAPREAEALEGDSRRGVASEISTALVYQIVAIGIRYSVW